MPNEIIGLVDKTTGIGIPNADARFATSAQGAKADTALQSGAAISVISGLQCALDGKQAIGSYATDTIARRKVFSHICKPRHINLAATDANLKGFIGGFTDGRYGYFVPRYNGTAYHGYVARLDLNFGVGL